MTLRLSLSTKVFLGFALVITTFGVASVYSIVKITGLRSSIRFLRAGVIPASDSLRQLDFDLGRYESALSRRGASDVARLTELLPNFRPYERVERLAAQVAGLAGREDLRLEDRRVLEEFGARLGALGHSGDGQALLSEPLTNPGLLALRLGPHAPLDDARLYDEVARVFVLSASADDLSGAHEALGVLKQLVRRLKKDVVRTNRDLRRAVDVAYERAGAEEGRAILTVTVTAGVALLVGLLTMLVTQLALRPLRELRAAVERVARGDYERRIPVRTADEVGTLAAEFNRMGASLEARDRALARQRDELVEAERLATVGRMAAHIAHEVRNPLSSIGLNVDLLEEELTSGAAPDPAEARALLGAIAREVDRLSGVTEQYLRVARAPRQTLAPTDLGELLRDLLRFLAPQFAQANIRVAADVGPLPPLEADGNRLRQAFVNILRNAEEAMPGGGSLRVTAAAEGPDVVVAVADTGTGLGADARAHLFEPFFTTKAGGTGLGLALTHQIVTELGGSIQCANNGEMGTVFTVRLPATSDVPRGTSGDASDALQAEADR